VNSYQMLHQWAKSTSLSFWNPSAFQLWIITEVRKSEILCVRLICMLRRWMSMLIISCHVPKNGSVVSSFRSILSNKTCLLVYLLTHHVVNPNFPNLHFQHLHPASHSQQSRSLYLFLLPHRLLASQRKLQNRLELSHRGPHNKPLP
jgi:hypothetical protein